MVIGLTLAAPVGPIALICIRRTMAEGKLHGIVSGIGVATSDSFYAAVAVLGLTVISGFIISHETIFRIIASIGLIVIGAKICLSVPPGVCSSDEHGTYLKDYLSMVAITIANPLTLLFFVTILPGFGIMFPGTSSCFFNWICCGDFLWLDSLVDIPLQFPWLCPVLYRSGHAED